MNKDGGYRKTPAQMKRASNRNNEERLFQAGFGVLDATRGERRPFNSIAAAVRTRGTEIISAATQQTAGDAPSGSVQQVPRLSANFANGLIHFLKTRV